MSRIAMSRANYARPNPNLRCGVKTAANNSPEIENDRGIVCHVYVKDCVRHVSSFSLNISACYSIVKVTDSDLTPFQIHARLMAGKSVKTYWNNKPAIVKIN